MEFSDSINMHSVARLVLATVCFLSVVAQAGGHYEDGIYIPDGVCVGNCSDTSSSSSSAPSGPSAEEVRQQKERLRQKAKAWSSDEAQDYVGRKDWDNAIRSFEEALDHDPDDPDLIDALNRARTEKAKSRLPAVAAPSRPAPVNIDKSVVDARAVASSLPASVDAAIPHTPSGDRVRKGFQAIQTGDWKLALAWFQDAHNKEPGNPGLRRLVDLAKFTLAYRSSPQSPAIEKISTPEPTKKLPVNTGSANSVDEKSVKIIDNSLSRSAAGQMAARARADKAYKKYVETYGDHYSAERTIAVSKAYRGEGYSDKELKEQLQKSLLEYSKSYYKRHPDGRVDGVGGSAVADEIILGGKG